MTIDYGLHTLRLNRQYEARMRRAMERFKEAIDTLWDRIDDLEASVGLTMTTLQVDINGNSTENIADPTTAGQLYWLYVNKVVSAGTFTLDFDTNAVNNVATYDKMSTATAPAFTLLIAGSYLDTLRWFISSYNSNFTLVS